MKLLSINGSPRKNGNCEALIKEISTVAKAKGAEIHTVNLNELKFKGCQGCNHCKKNRKMRHS